MEGFFSRNESDAVDGLLIVTQPQLVWDACAAASNACRRLIKELWKYPNNQHDTLSDLIFGLSHREISPTGLPSPKSGGEISENDEQVAHWRHLLIVFGIDSPFLGRGQGVGDDSY